MDREDRHRERITLSGSTAADTASSRCAMPPPGTKDEPISSVSANGRIQKLKLFMRGSAMSGAPTCIGTIQLASPTNAGMTAPKIMISPCIVVSVLNTRRIEELQPGPEQLGADQHRERATDEEHRCS